MRHARLTRKHKQRKQRKVRRATIRQRGGNAPLLDGADAPPAAPPSPIDFNARFQPNVKASKDGPTFTIYQVAHEPYPVWTPPTPPSAYTLICWDPDAPAKSFLHWLVVNCTGGDNAEGKVLAPWSPPNPPAGTGVHRYVLGLFLQSGPLSIPEITERGNFNATTFASSNGLVALSYLGFRVAAAEGPPPVAPTLPPVPPPVALPIPPPIPPPVV